MKKRISMIAASLSIGLFLSQPLPSYALSDEVLNVYHEGKAQMKVQQIARYDSQSGEGGTEIFSYDQTSKKGYVTNGAEAAIDIIDFKSIDRNEKLTSSKRVFLADFGMDKVSDITSIAAHPTKNLIAVSVVSEPKTEQGYVVFLTKEGEYLTSVKVGSLPDMVTFTSDGKSVLTANEGEPNDDYSENPEGSVSIISVPASIKKDAKLKVTNAKFTNRVKIDRNVRKNSKGTLAEQFEPEYIKVSKDSKYAYVVLQENNGIAKLNLQTKKFERVYGLGFKDHSLKKNSMDAVKDDEINLEQFPLLGMYQPDGIDSFTVNNKEYIITPNEGDARDYDGYSEEGTIADIKDQIHLNAKYYKGFSQKQLNQLVNDGLLDQLEDMKITLEDGKKKDGTYEALYVHGGRSFSIYEAKSMKQVYDSGNEFEKITATALPDYFNTDNDKIKKDARSNAKGPEPESAVVGKIGKKLYAFIGLERTSGIMVYDVTNPKKAEFVSFFSSRDYRDKIKGDVAPEGLQFIEAKGSPTRKPLLVATHEMSGTIAVYEIGIK
ncbi:hypothetical protein FZC66_09455 [Priestia megaterium]|nr:hypothetical protein FZC66_09455 [Priestia megaterium]